MHNVDQSLSVVLPAPSEPQKMLRYFALLVTDPLAERDAFRNLTNVVKNPAVTFVGNDTLVVSYREFVVSCHPDVLSLQDALVRPVSLLYTL